MESYSGFCFCIWVLLLNSMFLSCIHIGVCGFRLLLLHINPWCEYTTTNDGTRHPVSNFWPFCVVLLWAILVHLSWWISIHVSVGYIPRNGIPGTEGVHMFSFANTASFPKWLFQCELNFPFKNFLDSSFKFPPLTHPPIRRALFRLPRFWLKLKKKPD